MKLYVRGIETKNDEPFEVELYSKVLDLLNELADAGNDERIDEIFDEMGRGNIKTRVLNSFTWMQDAQEVINYIESHNRCAVMADDIAFGISKESFEDAQESFELQEF